MQILATAIMMAGLGLQSSGGSGDDLRLLNIIVVLAKVGSRIEAHITNPNKFAVYGVRAECDFADRHGRIIASNVVTVMDAVQGNETRHISKFDVTGWPDGAWTAACNSFVAKRLPP